MFIIDVLAWEQLHFCLMPTHRQRQRVKARLIKLFYVYEFPVLRIFRKIEATKIVTNVCAAWPTIYQEEI